MLSYDDRLEPYCNEWEEYILPGMCKGRIEEVCANIMKKGDKTIFRRIYDAMYEIVQDDIEKELNFNYDTYLELGEII